MANIKIALDYTIIDGQPLSFKAPCDCTAVTGIKVEYPDGEGTASTVFSFADAHGTALAGIGNLFTAGAMVRVLLDTVAQKAYVQNANTNSYLEKQLAGKASAADVGSAKDTFAIYATEHDGYYIGPTGNMEDRSGYKYYRMACANSRGKVWGVKTYGGGSMAFAFIQDSTVGDGLTVGGIFSDYAPDAEYMGPLEFDIEIPEDANVLFVSFMENSSVAFSAYEKKGTVWDEIRVAQESGGGSGGGGTSGFDSATLRNHIANKENPHGVTCEQIGAIPAGQATLVQFITWKEET